MSPDNERRFYRVEYPTRERPTLHIGAAVLHVVDCSESGLSYVTGGSEPPEVGTKLAGTVHFRDGERVEVVGEIVWAQDGKAALSLEGKGIPTSVIFGEQRYLRKHYPHRF